MNSPVIENMNIKSHLLMMLEAMQYKGSTKFMDNDRLRELVEEQKIVFLRNMQQEIEKEHQEKYGRPLSIT